MYRNYLRKSSFIILILLLLIFIMAGGCGAKEENTTYKTSSVEFYLQQSNGTYSLAEAVYPVNISEKIPLVVMAHGFSGTLNSGGAEELAHRLASVGIASIRMDFNPRISPEKDSYQTCLYDLQTMNEDMVLGIEYMLNHFNIDDDRIGLYGRSMGGRVVMTMANENSGHHDYKALAMVAPAGNANAMIDYMGGMQRWEKMKEEALHNDYAEHKGLKLKPSWFAMFEEYNPCETGMKFAQKPVLVICNSLDNVVTEATSRECASAYKNSQVIEVTTDNYHGYEMGYDKSELKDYLMEEITDFFYDSLCRL